MRSMLFGRCAPARWLAGALLAVGLAVGLALLFGRCEARAAERLASVLIKDVPHVKQRPDFCGEACAAMVLSKLGQKLDQNDVFCASGLDPVQARGCYTKELAGALTKIGFSVGPVWEKVEVAHLERDLAAQFQALHADLAAGVPSIVCMRTGGGAGATEHFRLMLGYDAQRDEVIYHEPAEEQGAYRRMKRAEFYELWPLKYGEKQWTVVRMKLDGEKVKYSPPRETISEADYAQHLMQLKERLPSDKFHIVLQRPFVVIGDEDAETVKQRAEHTVKWSVERLKRAYFSRDPKYVIDIWLFKDKESYEMNAVKLFHDKPTTPYGYFSSQHRALVMNISTGGGTLVHEIVHPFVASNFAGCPSWFNEGLASLYEQSGESGGEIVGYTNWRLAGLQEAIRRGRLGSFDDLCATSTNEFYGDARGTNYAQARYLCYYLQQQGKLRDFYKEFSGHVETDPTGAASLKKVLGERDLARFQTGWEKWVLDLKFPG